MINRWIPHHSSLAGSSDYHQLVREAFRILRMEDPRFSYGKFALKAGFAARSFPRDVELGLKGLSVTSGAKFCKGLAFKGDLRALFLDMIEKENPAFAGDQKRIESLEKRIEKFKTRLMSTAPTLQSGDVSKIYQSKIWPTVYAALGEERIGATLEEVVARTGYSEKECLETLELLEQVMFLKKGALNRYVPVTPNFELDGLGREALFKSSFIHGLVRAKKSAEANFDSSSALFLDSAFSVRNRDLPKLRTELRELILKFVGEAEHATGDSIASISLSLY